MISYSISIAAALLVAVGLNVAIARPQMGGGPPFGGPPPPIPPQLAAALPPDTLEQIKKVHADQTLGFHEKQEKIDKIMVALPADVLDKLPLPPGFEKLPEQVRDTIKNINRNKDKTWAEKQSQLHQYVQSLPAEQKALLMGPPPPPPPHGK